MKKFVIRALNQINNLKAKYLDLVKRRFKRGLTLIELLVVITILGILAIAVLAVMNPVEQIQKANDGKRKASLAEIQKGLENYYNDNGSYPMSSSDFRILQESQEVTPGSGWADYMSKYPSDPGGKNYVYFSPDGQSYYLYASLERKNDPQICSKTEPCSSLKTPGFPPSDSCKGICNYGVSSPNVFVNELAAAPPAPTSPPLPTSAPTGTPLPPLPTNTVVPPTATSIPPSSTPSVASSVKWAGARASRYGITPYPSTAGWNTALKGMSGYFPGSTPTTVWLAGEILFNGTNSGQEFNFPNPGGTWNSTIKFTTSDQNESYLSYFDAQGIKVFLQVEPGFSPIDQLFTIMHNKYGHHPSLMGFGVDVEWYRSSCDGCPNIKATDTLAQTWEANVKALNPNYKLFLKHYDYTHLPATYRGSIIFVDDTEQNGSYSNLKAEMKAFSDHFYPNPVIYQIGYPSDKPWWQSLAQPVPKTIGEALSAQTRAGQDTGVVWVDFSLRDVFPGI